MLNEILTKINLQTYTSLTMKIFTSNFIALLTIGLFSIHFANGQCTPNTSITQAGIYPDSATGLASGTVGVAYNQVIQLRVPVDTSISILPGLPPINVPITSITLTSFTGLPPGLTYSCNPANCIYNGGTNGCADISGTPTVAGTFNLLAITTTVGSVFGSPLTQVDTIDYYTITINSTSTGIDESTGLSFTMDQNTPNPCAEFTGIRFTVPSAGEVDFRMFNLIGKETYRSLINADQGENFFKMDSREFAPGVYMYTMTYNGVALSKRMVISRK